MSMDLEWWTLLPQEPLFWALSVMKALGGLFQSSAWSISAGPSWSPNLYSKSNTGDPSRGSTMTRGSSSPIFWETRQAWESGMMSAKRRVTENNCMRLFADHYEWASESGFVWLRKTKAHHPCILSTVEDSFRSRLILLRFLLLDSVLSPKAWGCPSFMHNIPSLQHLSPPNSIRKYVRTCRTQGVSHSSHRKYYLYGW